MLPAAYRLRSAADFAAVTRAGHRVRSGDMVVYLMLTDQGGAADRLPSDRTAVTSLAAGTSGTATTSPRAGLIVSRKVGGSVTRHRVTRRLRAQLASRLDSLPPGSRLVLRALPSAATASSPELGQQLDVAFGKLSRRVQGAR